MTRPLFDWLFGRRQPLPVGDADERLAVFLHHFLSPAALDGRLGHDEETPLLAAYHALDIHAIEVHLPAGEFERRCREVVARPSPPRGRDGTERALRTLARCAHRLSRQEWVSIVRWLTTREPGARVLQPSGLSDRPLPIVSRFDFAHLLRRIWRDLEAERPAPERLLPPSAASARTVRPEALVAPAPAAPALLTPSEPDPPVVLTDADPSVCERVVSGALAKRLRDRAAEIAAGVRSRLEPGWRPWLAFDRHRRSADDQAVCVDGAVTSLWFVGDVHGDLLALECALAHIRARDPQAIVVFLGDLVDDGPHSFEVVLRVLGLTLDEPERTVLLPGNHDEALRFETDSGLYVSSVSPSDFAEHLNAHLDDPATTGIANAFIALMAVLPRALFLADGLLAVHGGVPQRDLWGDGRLARREDLNALLCLQDFVWTRAHPRARRRMTDRHSRGAEFGFEDFDGFCEAASRVLHRPVERMVRGHDHIPERYSLYPNYRRHRIVTINTLASRLARELTGPPERIPCVARHRPGALPEVHRIRIPETAIRAVHGEREEGCQLEGSDAGGGPTGLSPGPDAVPGSAGGSPASSP